MSERDVQLERIDKGDGVRWCVRLGKRTLMFDDESAARTFAAQLHMRVNADKLTLVADTSKAPDI
ncbi:hypothetical protein [Phytopseudomonas punonensis]|uniref:Uncharacterized protein n=1 Tax=Phytopseudomonas punonensis TaxID=1220495 RepID=A0A1M7LQY3_9GAMM|nr:hypothetical protein [Pseudomonas punonensis]SHM80598.1 hypothetical protein SAMN05216288_4349 [Pseudomonas punonensis]